MSKLTESRSRVRDRWRPYATGKWFRYVRGKDFRGSIESARSGAIKWAKANGFVALTRSTTNRLYVKFVKEGAK